MNNKKMNNKKMNNKAEKLEVVKLTAAVSDLRQDVSKKPSEDELDQLKDKFDNLQLQRAVLNDKIQAAIQKEVSEWREIEKRKSNVVYVIPEETIGKSYIDMDRLKMEKIITDKHGVHDVKVTKGWKKEIN